MKALLDTHKKGVARLSWAEVRDASAHMFLSSAAYREIVKLRRKVGN